MHVSEQLAAYALDCLDKEEADQVTEHLAGCARCRAELKGYLEVTGRLAWAAGEAEPEAWVKRRLMQRVGSSGQRQEVPASRTWWSTLTGLFRRAAPAWGVAALALIAVLAAGNVWLWGQWGLWRQAHPRTQRPAEMLVVTMVASRAAPGANGTLVISSDGEYGSLVVENLPVPDAAHQYQVWLARGAELRSGGALAVNDHGYGVLEILAPEPLMSYSTFRVTLEPLGGSAMPTSDVVLEGSP